MYAWLGGGCGDVANKQPFPPKLNICGLKTRICGVGREIRISKAKDPASPGRPNPVFHCHCCTESRVNKTVRGRVNLKEVFFVNAGPWRRTQPVQ